MDPVKPIGLKEKIMIHLFLSFIMLTNQQLVVVFFSLSLFLCYSRAFGLVIQTYKIERDERRFFYYSHFLRIDQHHLNGR